MAPQAGLEPTTLRLDRLVVLRKFNNLAAQVTTHEDALIQAVRSGMTPISPAVYVLIGLRARTLTIDTKLTTVFDATTSAWTRSNGFSRKLANHAAATALNYFAYNFIKIHRTLRMSPAMAAGVTDRLWSVEDLVVLWEAYEQRRAERAA